MSAISIKEACEILDTNTTSICVSKNFKPFYIKSSKKIKNASFDLAGYYKREDFKVELVAKTEQFIEYLNKIEGMNYQRIAEVGNVKHHQQISNLDLGYMSSLELLLRFRYVYPFHCKRFDEYYGWKYKGRLENIA